MDDSALPKISTADVEVAQYLGIYGGTRLGPEHGLLFAVLLDALQSIEKGLSPTCANKTRVQAHRDVEWLARESFFPFSSAWICSYLNIDHGYLRRKIRVGLEGKLAHHEHRGNLPRI